MVLDGGSRAIEGAGVHGVDGGVGAMWEVTN